MITIWLAILGWFVAGFLGLMMAALACAAGRADEEAEHERHNRVL